MKRLLKISLDLGLLTLFPVLGYFALSFTLDKNLINIFTICYPVYFFYYAIKSIFGTGANISKVKDNNPHAVLSGLLTGTLVAILIYGIIIYFIDEYLLYMNVDSQIYKNFVIYSLLQTIIQVVFSLIIEKLYYEEQNTRANIYSILFNVLNFLVLVGTSLITKNQIIIINITLVSILLLTIYLLIKNCHFKNFQYKLDIKKCLQYDSIEVVHNLFFFFIFLFGISNTNEFGIEYTTALSFVTLITDTQWDLFAAIVTVAKIDITKKQFNYLDHLKNAYKLCSLIILSIILLFIFLFKQYYLNFEVVFLFLIMEISGFILYPLYKIKTSYLQLEYSYLKTTINKISSDSLRLLVSLIKIPICSSLGGFVSALYQTISYNIIFHLNYKVDSTGYITAKYPSSIEKKDDDDPEYELV